MKSAKILPILVLAVGYCSLSKAALMGTAWTYQGRLMDANDPADGLYDFEFRLFDDPCTGRQQGNTIDVNDTDVIDGYFTAELDFGSDVFNGNARWLEVGVRPGDSTGGFTTLIPRQELTPTPYAIFAQQASYAQGAADLMLPYSETVSSGVTAFSVANKGAGYVGNFEQFGLSNANGGLNVTTAAGQYGAKILNEGGYEGTSYGLHVTSEKDTGSWAVGIQSVANRNNSTAYGLRSEANSTNSYAYGGYFRANSGGAYTHGIYIDADNTRASSGYSYGLQSYSSSSYGRTYGVSSSSTAGTANTSNLYGIYSYSKHDGTSGSSYGMFADAYGSDAGNSCGIYAQASKDESDTAGTAYGGFFYSDNDRAGGDTYGIYTRAFGSNGNRYGLYSEATTSSGSYDNYGLYAKVSNYYGKAFGFYADLETETECGYGLFVDLDTRTTCTYDQFGLHSSVHHQGTEGNVYGVYSYTYSSDSGSNYAGLFAARCFPGDTGNLYGIYAYCDNDTSGNKYAVYGNGPVSGYDFYAAGAGTNYGSSSSIRWKKDVRAIDEPLDKVLRMRGVYFDWDAEHGGHHDVGMIAEEVGRVLPEIVQYEPDGKYTSGMDYSKLTPLLVEAVKELKGENDRLKDKINFLEKTIQQIVKAKEIQL